MMAVLACVALPQAGAEENLSFNGAQFSLVWHSDNIHQYPDIVGQGFGRNDKFYLMNWWDCKIEIFDQNGPTGAEYAIDAEYPGSPISHDEKGNMIVRLLDDVPLQSDEPEACLVKADGSQKIPITWPSNVVQYITGNKLRYFGASEGDFFSAEGGRLFFVGGNDQGVYVMQFRNGALVADECFKATIDASNLDLQKNPLTYSTETYVDAWKAADGKMHYLFVTRTNNPIDMVLDEATRTMKCTAIDVERKLPAEFGRGQSNGFVMFSLGGKNYMALPSLPNWLDGFFVIQVNDDGTLEMKAQHKNNYPKLEEGYQYEGLRSNWLNVEPIDEKSVYIYQYFPWGYMAKYKFEVSSTPLEWIVNEGTVGETYTVADDLVGVYVAEKDPTRVYAKDLGKYRDKAIRYEHQRDYVERCGLQTEEWDQSNWVLLGFETEAVARKFVGKLIKGGTLTGTLTDQLNPTMTVTAYEEPTEEQAYAENHYVTCNFMTPNVQTVADGEFFFMTPKPQEYCKVHWATFEGHDVNHFTVEKTVDGQTMGNEHGLAGGFPVDWSLYPGNPAEDFIAGNTYDFHAIVRWVSNGGSTSAAPRRAEGVPSEGRYMVFPLEGGDELVTAVTAPRAEVHPVGVTYVNVMGMMSSKPFPGLNIEVTHYSDGTTSSEKRMIK